MKIGKLNLFSVSDYSNDWLSWDKRTYIRPNKCGCCLQKLKYISLLPEIIYTVTYSQKFVLTLSNNILKWVFFIQCLLHVFYLNQSLLIVA